MRKLSDSFIQDLRSNYLSGLISEVKKDHDLDLEIRDNKIEVYYKGHDLLVLTQKKGEYIIKKHEIFFQNLEIPEKLSDMASTKQFVDQISNIKMKINSLKKQLLEQEYEQQIIRANNFEEKVNSEYFITDRQYEIGKTRFDLLGIHCEHGLRNTKMEVPMCLVEVKFAQNPDISNIQEQLSNYYETIRKNISEIKTSCETVFQQKLGLGLYHQSKERLSAMRSLVFSDNIDLFQFIILLVDFNAKSVALKLESLKRLGFYKQIRIYKTGFALWEKRLEKVS